MEIIKRLIDYSSILIECFAVIIILLASVKVFIHFITTFFSKATDSFNYRNKIRLDLGRTLALALEFLIAADVLKTAVAPSWDDIGKLAAIAAIRTALNYFLERDLKAVKEEEELDARLK